MGSNGCDTNHLDAEIRLPPRKRLLADLKKQTYSESTSQCSHENNPSSNLSPSISEIPLSEFDVRLNDLLKSYKNGSKMTPEEIADAAESAALAATKEAEVARAIAEEKAAIAAKAVAAAKNALFLIAYEETRNRDRHVKRNKLKKQPVQLLYDKYQPIESCGEDEELARKLHRTMNSSPRISKHSPKKRKMCSPNDKSGISNGTSLSDGDANLDREGSNEESNSANVDEKVLVSSKDDKAEVASDDGESSHSKEKKFEGFDDLCTNGRKRGRIKQKTMALSVLSSKDQAQPKDELNLTNSLITRARTDKVSPIEVAPTWKCQDLKVSQCIKQDKLVES